MSRGVGRVDHALGAALAAAYVVVLLLTAPALGLSRDEAIYVQAAETYARWLELLASDPETALRAETIDRHWRVNHEHPALLKTLFALGHLVQQKTQLFPHDSLAFRFPGMLCAGLLLWLIHVFGVHLYGRRAGLFAALAFALLPRPFYHAHLAAFDVPIALMVTAVAYAYLRSLTQRRWAIATGLLFGCALATKHNSWVLPGIFALHFAIALGLGRARGRRELSAVPYWLFALVLLGPPLFLGSWPWLFHDTLARLDGYAAFHVHHEYYNLEYFGVNYFWPPFPIAYPFVLTLYTVPSTTLACAGYGLYARVRAAWDGFRARAGGDDDPRQPTVLLLGCLLAPLVIIALPWTPIFGGTKHWFTAYPFLALFAGAGADRALTRAAHALSERAARLGQSALTGAFAWLLLPALVETAHSHPFGLSHYTLPAGFVAGAAERGMNRQFWGFTTGSLVDYLARALPEGGRVYACDTLDGAFRMLHRDRLLSPRILPTPHIADADLALVHHERHFAEVDHQIWTTYGSTRPVHVLTYDGVPIVSVYRNPRGKAR